MIDFRLEDVLAPFRALEANEDAIPILGDEAALKCLAAWSKTDHRWVKPKTRPPRFTHGNHAVVWEWMVGGWRLDLAGVAKRAGLSERTVHEKMAMLVGNRLMYPDGSMSKAAKTALNIYVAGKLGIKQTKPKAQSTAKAVDDDKAN